MNKTDAAGLVERTPERKLLVEFYASSAYDPKAARHADVVEAAIRFTLAKSRPPLGDVDELCGKDARELLAAEIRADWIASYPAEAVPSETYALKEAANQPAALRAIEKALSDRTALMAWKEEAEKVRARIAEEIDEGSGFWRACSGCQESSDGSVSIIDYPRSDLFQCQPGGGCRECGGIGVIWDDIDYDAMAREMIADDLASKGDGAK